jgi:GTP-binding protein EngB required for normal cell division
VAAEQRAAELAAAQRQAELKAKEAAEKAAREKAAHDAAVEAARQARAQAEREQEKLRAERAAAEAAAAEAAAAEAARRAAEEEHLRTIGFSKDDFNIAVVGGSGVGKTTFLNSARGLYADDDGAAVSRPGAEATMKTARYPMPGAPRIVWSDHPGGDTRRFPANEYPERRCIDRYDVIMVLYNNRFTAVVSAVIAFARQRGIPIVLVYTKMDIDVRNEQVSRGGLTEADAEAAVRERVRDDVANELRRLDGGVSVAPTDMPVYFIDSVLMLRGELRFDEKALFRAVGTIAARRRDAVVKTGPEELLTHVQAAIEASNRCGDGVAAA